MLDGGGNKVSGVGVLMERVVEELYGSTEDSQEVEHEAGVVEQSEQVLERGKGGGRLREELINS
jgi:hypothetical protein